MSAAVESSVAADAAENNAAANFDEYNMQELFGAIDWAEADIPKMEAEWREELAAIEQENVKALLDSTEKAQAVIPSIQKAIDEVSVMDGLLGEYSRQLKIMGMEIQQIEELNRGLNIQTSNQKLLLDQLNQLLEQLDMPEEMLQILQKEPLDSPISAAKILTAAIELHTRLSTKFENGLQNIRAVSERQKYFGDCKEAFTKKLTTFFNATFVRTREQVIAAATKAKSTKKITSKLVSLEELVPFLNHYKGLVQLLKDMDPKRHLEVSNSFQLEMYTMMKKELDDLFEGMKTSHITRRPSDDKKPHLFTAGMAGRGGAIMGLAQGKAVPASFQKNLGAIALLQPSDIPDVGPNDVMLMDQSLHYILLVLAQAYSKQESLCSAVFFDIDAETEEIDPKVLKRIELMMNGTFASAEESLNQFVDTCNKLDNAAGIELLVSLDQRYEQLVQLVPFIKGLLDTLKQHILHSCESFLNEQIGAIVETKISAKKRSGIFPFVTTFPSFIAYMEKILGNIEAGMTSRELMNQAYDKIGETIFASFDAMDAEVPESDEKGHTNASVMTIENSHCLLNAIRGMKITHLEPILKSSQEFYEKSLSRYSAISVHRVLGKLQEFFEGIENLRKTTPAEEVAFQTAYTKASAKKVIALYPAKEIKKALELLYKRLEKHFTDDINVLRAVWIAIKEEFAERCTIFVECIESVYPNSDVVLGFNVKDTMAYFSEISKTK